jgi:hypothetical protein
VDRTHILIHRLLYSFSALIVAATLALCTLSLHRPKHSEDIAELSGVLSAILMGFEMALFFGIELNRRNLLPHAIRKHGVWATRHLSALHLPMGAMACSMLLPHILLSVGNGRMFGYESIMGFVCAAFLFASLIAGLLSRMNRKPMARLHIQFSLIALLPFILHLAD